MSDNALIVALYAAIYLPTLAVILHQSYRDRRDSHDA